MSELLESAATCRTAAVSIGQIRSSRPTDPANATLAQRAPPPGHTRTYLLFARCQMREGHAVSNGQNLCSSTSPAAFCKA